MNSSRSKYTSTPTYGMQKRGFGKRQAEKTANPELDFTQKPAPDFDAPISGAPDPYAIPQGIYHDPVPQQGTAAYQGACTPKPGHGEPIWISRSKRRGSGRLSYGHAGIRQSNG